MNNNYTVLHCHTMLSNGVTNIDSVTSYKEYINKAKECGMTAMAISEHGSCFGWYNKKIEMEKVGIKYIHAEEFYVTETLTEKVRDNYHCLLIAKNYEGFLELNTLSSKSFNRQDNSYYYVPRISYDDLINTSDNIIISTACLAGILHKGTDTIKDKFFKFILSNKERCYLEMQPHLDAEQVSYNKTLYEVANKYGLNTVMCTDTHALNKEQVEARSILQRSKNIHFDNEDNFDLTFKTYEELIALCKKQNAIPMEGYLKAIDNTNVIADIIEPFDIDYSYKYPHLWGENSEQIFKREIMNGIKKRGVDKYDNYDEYIDRIKYEIKAYEHNESIDFMLLMKDIIDWCTEHEIYVGYGRGSCNGSVIAWLLGITEMDSIKHGLNFDRFMNVERVSLSDIDTDFPPSKINEVKDYIFSKNGLYCSDIITFNTIAMKGAIRDVCRALYGQEIPDELHKKMNSEAEHYNALFPETSKEVDKYTKAYLKKANYICKNVESNESKMRKEYPEVFKYVDMVNGTIVSVGSHPCGCIVAAKTLYDNVGLFTTSTSDYPISQINMKEVDAQNYVKLDLLKLDTIELINETCKLAGIERITPDNIDITDIKVWDSIRDDTTQIFQWEGKTGNDYIKKLLSDNTIAKFQSINKDVDRMTLLSIGNSAIRPAGASYREDLANGNIRTTGYKCLDDFLKPTFGFLVFQCQIIEFLHSYCGFTMGEADVVRRHFAKKYGTDKDIPIIKNGGYLTDDKKHYIKGFIVTMQEEYGLSEAEANEAIVDFIQVIIDASEYLFSLNHSQPYSYEGYVSGWLRYYYPLQFLTVALNINRDNDEKTKTLTSYAHKNGIKIVNPQFRHSKSEYMCDPTTNTIYKGIGSIKSVGKDLGDELYSLRNNHYDNFISLLSNMSIKKNQLDILVHLNFFKEFGDVNSLLAQIDIYNKYHKSKSISKDKLTDLERECIKGCYEKETAKKFMGINNEQFIDNLIAKTPVIQSTDYDAMVWQIQLLGYTDIKIESASIHEYMVESIEVDRWGRPWADLYNIKCGVSKNIEINKRHYHGLKQGDIIKAIFGDKKIVKYMGKDDKGKNIYKDTGQTRRWVVNYNKIGE
ncbi:MAG: PHP domain-containing protein [Paludibacteraceae bacterium]